MEIKNKNLLYPKLSYVLNGIFFKAHNDLGRFRNEKQYADAIERLLQDKKIEYVREYHLSKSFDGEAKNRNIVDFLVESKIILEIKAKTMVSREDYYQLRRYLSSTNCELGIIVNFRRRQLVPKRVLNTSLFKRDYSEY
ncbi:MAG: hypothetical protein UW71_C0019G0002 [Parcubacteria group bacterium GW2011_GWB1_44_7]|nr:MAG: hypothetical protein UW71_C0019G0002 [Parcubacteria group bacterium GW2011_GWB1_44_7]